MNDKVEFGPPVTGWTPPPVRAQTLWVGNSSRWSRLMRMRMPLIYIAQTALMTKFGTNLPYGPFTSAASYHRWVRDVTKSDDPCFGRYVLTKRVISAALQAI